MRGARGSRGGPNFGGEALVAVAGGEVAQLGSQESEGCGRRCGFHQLAERDCQGARGHCGGGGGRGPRGRGRVVVRGHV